MSSTGNKGCSEIDTPRTIEAALACPAPDSSTLPSVGAFADGHTLVADGPASSPVDVEPKEGGHPPRPWRLCPLPLQQADVRRPGEEPAGACLEEPLWARAEHGHLGHAPQRRRASRHRDRQRDQGRALPCERRGGG